MARTVNPDEVAAKRGEILDAAQRLIYTRGYERMTIQDLLGQLGMSNGAFFHYFNSKAAVLEALIERIQQSAEQALLPIVDDTHLSALDKLQRFFDTLDGARVEHQAFVAELLRVWFADDNAVVREKMYEAMRIRRTPLLTAIIHQGIQEGVFTTPYPDQAADIILSLARGMGTTIARLMLAVEPDQGVIDAIVAAQAAYADALERVLGAPAGSLDRYDEDAIKAIIATLRGG